MGLFDKPGKLATIWKDAKGKAGPKADSLITKGDLSPNLNALEDAVAKIKELRPKIRTTIASYRGQASENGLTDLVTSLDSIQSQVDALIQEVGKLAEPAKTG
jgi:hypothetical protein